MMYREGDRNNMFNQPKPANMTNFISWVDIPATRIERAVQFYGSVFNVTFEVLDCGTEKMACFPGGEGAISSGPGLEPSPNGVLVSFLVKEGLEKALEKVTANGGKIDRPKTKIEVEGRGYFAIVFDSEGNRIGLYEEAAPGR